MQHKVQKKPPDSTIKFRRTGRGEGGGSLGATRSPSVRSLDGTRPTIANIRAVRARQFLRFTCQMNIICSSFVDPGNIGLPHTISENMQPTPLWHARRDKKHRGHGVMRCVCVCTQEVLAGQKYRAGREFFQFDELGGLVVINTLVVLGKNKPRAITQACGA